MLVHVPKVSHYGRSGDVGRSVGSGTFGSQSGRRSVHNTATGRRSGSDSQYGSEHVTLQYGSDSDGDYTEIRPNMVYHFVHERDDRG
jgi:hypothetical protein